MRRISTGAKVGAALVACLALPAAAVLVTAFGDLRDDDAQATADLLDTVDAATAVSEHLDAEGAWYGIELTGFAEALDLPPGVDADSPRRTDEAVEALHAVLEGQDAGTSAAYAPAVDALEALDDIRGGIEANRGTPTTGSAGNLDLAADVRTRYAQVSDAVRQATAAAVDDPDLRANVDLGAATARQRALLDQMMSSLLTTDGAAPDTTDEITAIAALLAQWQEGDATLRVTGAPYDTMVEEHLPADMAAEVATVVEQTLLTGTLDIPVLVGTVSDGAAGLTQLEAAIAEQRDELARAAIDAEEAHERRMLLVVAASGLMALSSVAVAIVILVLAASRRPGTAAPLGNTAAPQWPLP